MSRKAGLSEQQLAELDDFEASTAFTDLEKQVLHYAEALTQAPAHASKELFDSLREYFDPRQMVELTSAIAWENFRARFNRGFGIGAEGFMDGAACPVHVTAQAAMGGLTQ